MLIFITNYSKPELARMRLQAGCCMLKVAEEPCFAEIITREQFQALALLINVSCREYLDPILIHHHIEGLTTQKPEKVQSTYTR